MADIALEMDRGDDRTFVAAVALSGQPVNITGLSMRFTAKRSTSDADNEAIITKTTPTGIAITDGPNGIAEIRILAADTSGLVRSTVLVWDLQMRDGSDKTVTVARGTLKVKADVSQTSP